MRSDNIIISNNIRYFSGILLLILPLFAFGQIDFSQLDTIPPLELVPEAKISFPAINEASGLVKSRLWRDVYWTHNDSGDEARIFPLNAQGQIITPEWAKDTYAGIKIAGAANVDWEDICADQLGNLYIADCGNNDNLRRDLTIYVIKEPYPESTDVTSVFKKYNFYYPEQRSFPPEKRNFDCEAIFYKDGIIYLLTKHRSDTNTSLYRLDSPQLFFDNPAVFIDEFHIKGRVTAADCSPDGKKLAVLTYSAVWIFQSLDDADNFFKGKIFYLPYKADWCEGICFDDDKLMLISEPGLIYRIPVSALYPIVNH